VAAVNLDNSRPRRVRISEAARKRYRVRKEYGFIAHFQYVTLGGMHPENRIMVVHENGGAPAFIEVKELTEDE
jgi:hypothetical protein